MQDDDEIYVLIDVICSSQTVVRGGTGRGTKIDDNEWELFFPR